MPISAIASIVENPPKYPVMTRDTTRVVATVSLQSLLPRAGRWTACCGLIIPASIPILGLGALHWASVPLNADTTPAFKNIPTDVLAVGQDDRVVLKQELSREFVRSLDLDWPMMLPEEAGSNRPRPDAHVVPYWKNSP